MGASRGKKIVTDGLIYYMDAANKRCYPGSGTNCFDLIRSNDTVLTNGTSFDSGNGGSFDFDGTNDYIGNIDLTFLTAPFSIELFINFNDVDIATRFFTTVSRITGDDLLLMQQDDAKFRIYDGTSYRYTTTTIMSTGIWYHHVMTLASDGQTCKGYLNGVEEVSQTITNTAFINHSDYAIGRKYEGFGNYFNGKISNFKIYNRVLTSSEVLQNYNALKDRFI